MSKQNKKKGKVHYDKQGRADKPARDPGAVPPQPRPATGPAPAAAPVAAPSPVVTLTPLVPLIVRSGRPFDDQAGADAARLPPPSTVAGCLRTAWARTRGLDFAAPPAELSAALEALDLLALRVTGPLLVRPRAQGGLDLLAPKPADAHYFGRGGDARCLRAEPGRFGDGLGADLPEGLHPVFLSGTVQGKPGHGPAWWAWEDLLDFRSASEPPTHADLSRRGWSPPADDRRTHVAIDPATLAAAGGRLFQTAGLDLEPCNPRLEGEARSGLRLLARCSEPLPAGLVHLGGERRLAHLEPEPLDHWPAPPDDWFEQIQATGGLTLTLLTLGAFSAGYRPGWLGGALVGEPPTAPGVRLRLAAVAGERWQAHSGWDLARRAPRPTRKLVAAGAVYWFRLLDCPGPEALAPLWLASISDAEQDRRDGFGLVLPAPWAPTV